MSKITCGINRFKNRGGDKQLRDERGEIGPYKLEPIKDVAYHILKERKEPVKYKDLVNEIVQKRGLREGQTMAQFMAKAHTEISMDYRFQSRGQGMCGLTEWTAKPPAHRVITLPQSVSERQRAGDRLRREMMSAGEDYVEEETADDELLEEPDDPEGE